ncbi:MAG: protein kinase [Elusimicrobia bacterium]|nr:protein kinase [Elusimicrobiota bacterium]
MLGPALSLLLAVGVVAQKTEPEASGRVDEYGERLPESARAKFHEAFHRIEPERRGKTGDLLHALLHAKFDQAVEEGGIDPRGVREFFRLFKPFLFERDAKTGRFDRPFRPRLDFWRRLAQRFPRDPDGHAQLGGAAFEGRDYSAAAAAYDKAIALGAREAEAYVGRGLAAERLGDYEQAQRDASAALELSPGDPNAAALLMSVRGRESRARLGLGTGDPPGARAAPEGVGRASAGGAAVRDPAHAASAEPETAGVSSAAPTRGSAAAAAAASGKWAREAERALQLGDLNAAFRAATRAIAINPGNADAYNLRAMARDRQGDREGSFDDATRGLELAPGNVALLNTRSWTLSGLKRFDAAFDDSVRAVGLSPDNAYARVTRARAEGALGRRTEMVESLREAARLDPRFAQTLEAALELPSDRDTELLFQGGTPGQLPKRGAGRLTRFLFLLGSTLVGGLLVAMGLLHAAGSGWRERLTLPWRKPRRPGEQPPAGRFWDYYTFRRVIASGGMGIVYEAIDRELDRRVAVKKLRGEMRGRDSDREAFLREARTVAALRHPAVVEIYAVVEDGQDLYLVFEYVEGKTLQALLQERGRLGVGEAAALLRDICAAVQRAHDKGVIHRDLKPSNVMVTTAGLAKVMDFGVARQSPETRRITLTPTVAGTPHYMAPEAEQGMVCKESDVFSLGVCFYEMITGRLPYEGMAGALALRKQAGKFEPASRRAPGIPAALDQALARALAPSPEDRYDSPASLYADIGRFA